MPFVSTQGAMMQQGSRIQKLYPCNSPRLPDSTPQTTSHNSRGVRKHEANCSPRHGWR
ncbi:hypothetical protein SCLCIDRAFT_1214029 [Scleroderma citrinum Foug A]|uniref:Uncharacterized protein n=1 Tax=Scleroderma citrinum Foug A TaxID=1036808 RepID=A0A0C3E5D5_9AGAM|nr:hypothetical protein SCLCIDRAFT_1214029 [Scleroderma citrinum Foug A]